MNEETLSVGQLQRKAKNALAREFRGPVWVAGEVRSIREQRGNVYLTLVEPEDHTSGGDTSLDVAAWSNKAALMRSQLVAAGLTLAAGMQVRVHGDVSLSKVGRLNITLLKLDIEALLGGQAAEKKRLYASLTAEGIIDANKRLATPLVPLRVGLVTSENTDGCNDFLGQLDRSAFAFQVHLAHTQVQGPAAPQSIARAISSMSAELDVIALVRGGGGELDAFDKEPVARAICSSRIPVWTGVGHTGDRSVADDVAQRALITPTECGQAIVAAVAGYMTELSSSARRLHQLIGGQYEMRHAQLDALTTRLSKSEQRHHDRKAAEIVRLRENLRSNVNRSFAARNDELCSTATTLIKNLRRFTAEQEVLLQSMHKQVSALDPERPLRLGYSLTHDAQGQLLRDSSAVGPGDEILTQLASGKIRSKVVKGDHG